MRGYGLGVQKYAKRFSWGEPAIGHGGGNIGTTTYMVYLPDYQVSVVVMVNAFPNRTADVITRGLIKTVLEDLNAFSMTRYLWTSINFYKSRMIVMLAIVSWIMGITYLAVKRRNSLRHREEAPDGFRFNG